MKIEVKNRKEFEKLSSSMQGALWPVCKNCKHIVQEHDMEGCGFHGLGQCASCGQWTNHVKCQCKVYVGPQTVDELIEYLNNG